MEKKKTSKIEEKEVETNKSISIKKVVIICAVILVLILGGFYIYKWRQVKNEEKLMKSYLITSGTVNLEIKNLDEVSILNNETPTNYFVLITNTGNEDAYNLEKGLKSIIDQYKLGDEFYYLNVKNIMKEDNYLTRINTAFNTDVIKTIPVILYYKDGKLIDTVKRLDNKSINAADFQKLLDMYDF